MPHENNQKYRELRQYVCGAVVVLSLLHHLGLDVRFLLAILTIPPQTHAQAGNGHGSRYLVWHGQRSSLLLGLVWASGCLVGPLLADNLEANHFVIIVKESGLLVAIPNPELIGVVILCTLGKLVKGNKDVVEEVSSHWREGSQQTITRDVA